MRRLQNDVVGKKRFRIKSGLGFFKLALLTKSKSLPVFAESPATVENSGFGLKCISITGRQPEVLKGAS